MTPEQERELVEKLALHFPRTWAKYKCLAISELLLSVVRTSIKEHPEWFVRVCEKCCGQGQIYYSEADSEQSCFDCSGKGLVAL